MAGPLQNPFMFKSSAAGGGDFYTHQIAHSVRNNFDQNGTMLRTPGTPSSTTTMTLSMWIQKQTTFPYANGYTSKGNENLLFTSGSGSDYMFISTDRPGLTAEVGGRGYLTTNALLRDTNAWYHIVLRVDTTQGATANRVRFYINGVEPTYSNVTMQSAVTQNAAFPLLANGVAQGIGGVAGVGHTTIGTDTTFAEVVFNDGQSYGPDSYGEFKNGVWIPKDPSGLTFGNQGFHLDFANASAFGNDVSGNNNDFTVANFSTHDQLLSSPTFNSNSNGGNFATLGRLWRTENITYTEGNLAWTGSANERGMMSNWAIPVGSKVYFEYYASAWAGSENDTQILGVNQGHAALIGGDRGGDETAYSYRSNGYKAILTTKSAYGSEVSWGTGSIISCAVDRVNHTINFAKNNSYQGTFAISATMDLYPFVGNGGGTSVAGGYINFGADGTFAGTKTAGGNADENGYGNFIYTPPSGFLAMCSGNLPVADAIDPAQTDDDYPQKLFGAKLYTGNASTNNITGLGFKPDWTWFKIRNTASNAVTVDSNRGTNKVLFPTNSGAEVTSANLTAFGTDGFSLDGTTNYLANFNGNTNTYVAWCQRANGGTTSSDASGNITSVGQVDPSGCFSIFTYTGSGTAGNTVAHHLDQAPDLMIFKERGNANNWITLAGTSYMNDRYMYLDTTAVANTGLYGGGRTFSSSAGASTFTLEGATEMNRSSGTYVSYGFSNCEGYIKIGEYEGNGNADGAFVYTGFRPAFIMAKSADSTSDWFVFDNLRDGYNVDNNALSANTTAAQTTTDMIDILSNGFKCRIATDPNVAETYVYLAFAENPFKYATAR
jgi:hypothetical protein